MTANGDGLNFDFLDQPEPQKKPAEPLSALPLKGPDSALNSEDSGNLLDGFDENVLDEDPTSSIFDEIPSKPIESIDELPDAIPNISDGGTAILVRGRTEIQEFSEDFGGAACDSPAVQSSPVGSPDRTASGVNALGADSTADSETCEPTHTESLHETAPTEVIQNPLGGSLGDLLDDSESTTTVSPNTDTIVAESPFRGEPLPEETEPEIVEFPDSEEPSGMSLESLDDTAVAAPSVATATGTATVAAASSSPPKSGPATGHSRTLLIAIGGYAILVTILCVLLLSLLSKARSGGQLESLPDLKPIPPGKVAIYKTDAELPKGHTLKIGDSQRYGNLRVEPIKVTRGPIRFEHYSGEKDKKGFSTEPVLKLWVKLTNESLDQPFIPLDKDLLFRRHQDAQDNVRANTFLVEKANKAQGYPLVFVYDHPLSSDWDLAGLQIDQPLAPGESIETYIPTTEEGIDRLTGDLLWRIQLRKGHSPGGYGVTTLVEVTFSPDQIVSEGT